VYAAERAAAGARLLWDERHQVFYEIVAGRASIRILAATDHVEARVALMRVVRELAAVASATEARVHLHAAAFALGDAGAAIVGAKGAGKTTLLLHALHIPGAAFVANDRLHIHDGPLGPRARGIPTIVNVRAPTRAMFPELAARLARFHHGSTVARPGPVPAAMEPAAGVSPAQLCRAAGVEPRAESELRVIVFPGLGATGDDPRVERLPAAETARRLVAGLFHAAAPATLADAWIDGPPDGWTETSLRRRCAELAAAVPGYACRMGRLAAWSPATAEALRRLVAESA
jgi:hypothetical protein